MAVLLSAGGAPISTLLKASWQGAHQIILALPASKYL